MEIVQGSGHTTSESSGGRSHKSDLLEYQYNLSSGNAESTKFLQSGEKRTISQCRIWNNQSFDEISMIKNLHVSQ